MEKKSRPRLAIVSSQNASCANAYFSQALTDFLSPVFDVQIVDLKSYQLLIREGEVFLQRSEAHINEICRRLQEFDLVNIHYELGLYGTKVEQTIPRIWKLCQASKRLIVTVHSIDVVGGLAYAHNTFFNQLKQRPSSNPFHVLVNLPREKGVIEEVYGIRTVTDFPVIFLTDERRQYFMKISNSSSWKKQFGLKDEDITIGVFGILNAYKNLLHAFQTLRVLPIHYKLLIIGEAYPANIRQFQVDPVIKEMTSYLDNHPDLRDRVVFTGKRDDMKFNEDLANIDYVLIPYFEVGQSASATLSNALEMTCAILMSNTFNCREYQKYFPNCFEVFDIGNYYETKNKILNFDKTKIENLKKAIKSYSEERVREMYMSIYDSMKEAVPVNLSLKLSSLNFYVKARRRSFLRVIFRNLPNPVKSLIKKMWNKLQCQ